MMETYWHSKCAKDFAYRNAKHDGRAVLLFYKSTLLIRFGGWLLGHGNPIHHTSLLYYNLSAGVCERELCEAGKTFYLVHTPDFLEGVEGALVLPPSIECALPSLHFGQVRMTWRSLLRSGIDHTFPPISRALASAILRVFGDDPTPITCSGYVLHLLTGTTDPHELTIPPHILPLLLANYYDLPRR